MRRAASLLSTSVLAATLLGCSGAGDGRLAPSAGDAATGEGASDGGADTGDLGAAADGPVPDGSSDGADPSAASEAATDVTPPACPIQPTATVAAGAARSGGFTGTDTAYFALYDAPCEKSADCVPACVAAGGTGPSCASGSECLAGEAADGGLGCLPPTYWLSVSGALSASGTTANAAELILVDIPYDDPLVLTNFGFSIDDDVTITGIRFQVDRASLAGDAVDDTVRILRDGQPVGTDRAQPAPWPGSLSQASYGGAYDLWGASWTAADLRSDGFGISITPKYTGPSAGNERAYIDSVRATIYYTTTCD
jgi:hypothetical protein